MSTHANRSRNWHNLGYMFAAVALLFMQGCHVIKPSSVHTEIVELKFDSFDQASPLLQAQKLKNAIYVFDIDNTLLKSDSLIGSEKWVDWYLRNRSKLSPCIFDVVNISYEMGSMSRTDPYTKAFFNFSATDNVIILTARDNKQRSVTLRELQRNDLDANINPPSTSSWFTTISTSKREHFVIYADGLMMASGGNKGTALKRYLDSLNHKFDTVVVIDDKGENLENVKVEMEGAVDRLILMHYLAQKTDESSLTEREAELAHSFDRDLREMLSSYYSDRYKNFLKNECLY